MFLSFRLTHGVYRLLMMGWPYDSDQMYEFMMFWFWNLMWWDAKTISSSIWFIPVCTRYPFQVFMKWTIQGLQQHRENDCNMIWWWIIPILEEELYIKKTSKKNWFLVWDASRNGINTYSRNMPGFEEIVYTEQLTRRHDHDSSTTDKFTSQLVFEGIQLHSSNLTRVQERPKNIQGKERPRCL